MAAVVCWMIRQSNSSIICSGQTVNLQQEFYGDIDVQSSSLERNNCLNEK